jgi:hypothetical protein
MFVLVAFDLGFTLAAAADGTHSFFSEKESAVFSWQSSVKPWVTAHCPLTTDDFIQQANP